MNNFFASIYELPVIGFYESTFSQAVYEAYLYQKYGIVLLITSLIMSAIYYKGLDSPRFANIAFWFLVLLLTVIINFLYLYIDAEASLSSTGFTFEGEYLSLSFTNGIYAAILFSFFSIIGKNFSVSNSKIPF